MTTVHAMYDAEAEYAVGVDIGGTKINAGLIHRSGEVAYTASAETQARQFGVIGRAQAVIETVLAEATQAEPGLRLAGIGVGTAGQVDVHAGRIRFANGLMPGYGGTEVKRHLQEAFGLPVAVDNDANVLALTERALGAGKGAKHLLCLTLGTGVGGAIMVDGRLVHGAWGGAGELGHISVDWRGPRCVCGSIGCLEVFASGTGIARRMRELLGESVDDQLDAKAVIARWQAGDATASQIMEETMTALGSAIASLLHMFNPEVIVIGGGVAEAGDVLLDGIRTRVRERAMPSLLEGVRIVPAYKGNWSGMIGAGLLVWERSTKGYYL
ncbi:ROK family protein [Paenibacillus thalictri]|uniref:ROK family protein n=1 Tax=Paenibacillus thalictri TaxID=2527873 RepID=UPI0013EEF725|nr:ROK family protein [Paenibacillus thalictri]